MTKPSEIDRWGKDHVCCAKVAPFAHPSCLRVQLTSRRQLDELIRLLTDLRDHPEAQRSHIHLQDVSYRKLQKWTPQYDENATLPCDAVEIVFYSPDYRCNSTDQALVRQGKRWLRRLSQAG
ncbi:MAG: hypothetical protein KKI08_04815 [Armatimonadetes bacterium]|nr:hypothetical protein [Armatimonadota bacterium]